MSMRLFVALLAGVLVMGSGRAFAVSASGSMDSPAAESRDDLFATKPASPDPAPVVAPAAATVERPPAPPPAQRVLSDNPLWAIPLVRLTASRERPLFAPTRRPPAPAPVAMPAPVQVAPPPPAEPEKPQLSLLGTIVGSEKIGLFVDSASKSVVRLKAGDNHKGWTLRAVERRQVEFARGLDIAVLDIPSPDMKAGAAPGGPMLAGPPPVPVAMPVPPPQGAAAPPSYVHPGASKSLTINKNAQPANFKLPPGLLSPFATQGQR
jgi:general secretion pathway protein N